MTNREKYAEELLDLACIREDIAFDKRTMKVIGCNSLDCDDCLFGVIGKSCSEELAEWAESEYVKPVKISKKDRAFLDYLKDKWEYMTRDKVGGLSVYIDKPRKDERFGVWCDVARSTLPNTLLELNFPMVKWSDVEPWKIEDLKELEVVDEY